MQTEQQQPLSIGGGPHHLLHHPASLHQPHHHHHLHPSVLARGGSNGSAAGAPGGPPARASPSAAGVSAVAAAGSAGSLCVGCGSAIQDQYILRVAPDLEWHASCLKCVECGVFLDENCTCFVRDGKTFCRRDYVRLFGAKCDKCGSGFSRSDFVMRAKSKIYHIECFRCTLCQRQLVPGDEFALRDDGNLFCKDDHDQNGLAPGGNNNNNNNNVSNVNNNNMQHLQHHQPAVLQAPHHHHHHSLLLEAKAEHHNQSSNSSSGTVSFMPLGGSTKSHKSSSGRHSRANSNDSHSDSSDTCITTSTSRKEMGGGERGLSGRGHGGKSDRVDRGGVSGGSDGKPTRVRTVLNEKQLHTLRTCYAANPRPDALMKEQLVEMTGLSPRVIRVWFQNKRCKDKKKAILMKQIQQQEKVQLNPSTSYYHLMHQHQHEDGRKLGFGSMQGIPLIASSPVRHGESSPGGSGGGSGGGGINPVEVHAFAPPWKALAEFALHNDLDRIDPSAPHFQQLINQMHGYDIHGPPDLVPHHHPGLAGHPQQHGGSIPLQQQQHLVVPPMDHPHGMMGGPQHLQHQMASHPSQHDPSDSYVQFLDSDEDNSMHHDGHSP